MINHDICSNGSKWSILYNNTNVCNIDLKSSEKQLEFYNFKLNLVQYWYFIKICIHTHILSKI